MRGRSTLLLVATLVAGASAQDYARTLRGTGLASNASQPVPERSKDHARCLESEDAKTTVGMLQCIETEMTLQDARLNKAYKKVMADLDAPGKKALQDAQRQWITYRDADCAFHRSLEEGGTLAAVEDAYCVLEQTAIRAGQLESVGRP